MTTQNLITDITKFLTFQKVNFRKIKLSINNNYANEEIKIDYVITIFFQNDTEYIQSNFSIYIYDLQKKRLNYKAILTEFQNEILREMPAIGNFDLKL